MKDRQRRDHKGFNVGDPLTFKADATQGVLSGYASKFYVVDSYGEFTVPGCFAKTIAERGPQGANRILLRYEHEWTVGAHTTMAEDGVGLKIEAKISDDGQWGTAVRTHLADGVPYGLSIGYRLVGYRTATPDDPLIFPDWLPSWVQRMQREELLGLTEINLKENSVVSFPAVDPALVDGYRSERLASLLAALLPDLKAGRLSDEDLAALKQIVDAWPADGAPARGETPAGPRDARTVVRRNLDAELDLLLMETGLAIEGIAA